MQVVLGNKIDVEENKRVVSLAYYFAEIMY